MNGARQRLSTLFPLFAALIAMSPPVAFGDGDQQQSTDAAQRSLYAANGLLNRGLFELAAGEYEQFLANHASHSRVDMARYGLGVCRFRLQQHEKAIEQLRALEQTASTAYAAESLTMFGQSLLATEQPAKAADVLKRVVADYESHELADDAAAALVEAHYRAKQFTAAAAACDQFFGKWPEGALTARVAYFGGRALMAAEEFQDAGRWFDRVVEADSNGAYGAHATYLRARCHHESQRIPEAIEAYRRVLAGADARFMADATLALAMLLRVTGKFDEAGNLLDDFLKDNEGHALASRAWYERGHVWMALDNPDKASRCFERAGGGDDPAAPDANAYWAAKAKLRASDAEGAARMLGKAVERFPESALMPHMLYDLGVARLRSDDRDAAEEALGSLRTRFPAHELAADALYILASSTHETRRFEQSSRYCDELVRAYPENARVASAAFLALENAFLAGAYEDAAKRAQTFLTNHSSDERAAKARFRLGLALHKLDRLDDAERVLTEVVRVGGKNATFAAALLALGDIYFQRGEWKNAAQRLGQYVASDDTRPSVDEALLKLGLACQRDGDFQRAIEAFEKLIAEHNSTAHAAQAVFEKGQALMALKRWDDARSTFQDLDNYDGAERLRAFAAQHLGSIAMRAGDYSEAAEQFARIESDSTADENLAAAGLLQRGRSLLANRDYGDAAAALGEFVRRFERHVEARAARAQQVIALARSEQCGDAMNEARALQSKGFGDLDKSLRSSVMYEAAWCLRASDQIDQAKKHYEMLASGGLTEELQLRGLFEWGVLEEQAEDFAAAAKQYQRLSDLPSDAPTLPADVAAALPYRLGTCLYKTKEYDEAVESLETFLSAPADSDDRKTRGRFDSALYFCGDAYAQLGQHDKAAKKLAELVERDPDKSVLAPALLRLADADVALQRWARAEQTYMKYVQRFADRPQAYQAQFGLGWCREHQQRYDEAIASYRKVAQDQGAGPTAARAQFQIGECLFAQEKLDEAARELLKVDILFAYPEWSAAALFEAGRCLERSGKRVEAAKQFQTVVDNHGGSKWAKTREQLSKVGRVDLPGRGTD